MIQLLDSLAAAKRQPNLAFAAARLHGATAPSYAEFREQLIARWHTIKATMLRNATQTNEAARTSTLLPWLADIERPIALLEVGASAGLCLYPDRYSHVYFDHTAELRLDPEDGPSAVVLRCRVDRLERAPRRMPNIVWRAGIDLNPVDVSDPAALASLEALVWPEHHERRARLDTAAKLVAQEPPNLVVTGDLLEHLAPTAAAAPPDAQLVVFHSAVMNYLSEEVRQAFVAATRKLDAIWLSNEGPAVMPWRIAREPVNAAGAFVLARNSAPVAFTSPHGQWIEWL